MKFNKCKSLLSTLFLMSMVHAKNNDSYYDKKEILAETQWKDVSIQENAPFHLSVLSQGRFDENLIKKYDKNYYYPSSAGEGVEIIVVDLGFNFTYEDFSDIDAKCEAVVKGGVVTKPESEEQCYASYAVYDHGSLVSSIIAGKINGVAKKANIHGILIDNPSQDNISLFTDFNAVLQYILDQNLIKSNKTVINFSIGSYVKLEDLENLELYKTTKSLIKEIVNKGAVIVAASGNDGLTVSNNGVPIVPCSLDNVICTGGIGTQSEPLSVDEIDSSFYNLGNAEESGLLLKSNYGEVDIYSPFVVHYQGIFSVSALMFGIDGDFVINEYYNKVLPGTSTSSPIVAGVIATLMSEFPEKEFNYETTLKYLTDLAEKDMILDLPVNENYPNLFINNGKKNVYDASLLTDIPSVEDIESISEDEVEVESNSDNEVEEIDSADEQ